MKRLSRYKRINIIIIVILLIQVTLYSTEVIIPGTKENYSIRDVSFKMAYVPGGKTFPVGYDDKVATVPNSYWIGETEVTYELWQKVYTWAINPLRGENRYYFGNAGEMGYSSYYSEFLKKNENGAVKTSQHPVTSVSWQDCIIWCNALTEWYNENNGSSKKLDCVYYEDIQMKKPSRIVNESFGLQYFPYFKTEARGFRLPTILEWELAARWKGSDRTNIVTSTIDGVDFSKMIEKWSTWNSASGATAGPSMASPADSIHEVAVCEASSTAVVKSKKPNALGLYDMSGNVGEWCYNYCMWFICRAIKGGNCSSSAPALQIYKEDAAGSFDALMATGFRIVRTH